MKKIILILLPLLLLIGCDKSSEYVNGYDDCITYMEKSLKSEDIRIFDEESILIITKHAYLTGYKDGLNYNGDVLSDSELEDSWNKVKERYKNVGKYE